MSKKINSLHLIDVANTLVKLGGKPKQAFLRRAVSTAYYALFHELAGMCADRLIGSTGSRAWNQVYRALDHGKTVSRTQNKMGDFSHEAKDFFDDFETLQNIRHQADYNPEAFFCRSEVVNAIERAQHSIKALRSFSGKDQRAIAVFILFDRRK